MRRGPSTGGGDAHSMGASTPGTNPSGQAVLNGLTNSVDPPLSAEQPQQHHAVNPATSALQNGVVGGSKLKKGTLWGQSEPGRPAVPPAFGVVGCSYSGDVVGRVSPRPTSQGRSLSRGGPYSMDGCMSPPTTSHGRSAIVHGSVPLGERQQPSVNNLELSCETPSISSRRLAAAASVPGRAAGPYGGPVAPPGTAGRGGSSGGGGGGGGTSKGSSSPSDSPASQRGDATPAQLEAMAAARAALDGTGSHEAQVMRLEHGGSSTGGAGGAIPPFPSADDAPPTGEAEGAWLRAQLAEGAKLYSQLGAQLQRVQQESHAIRSSLLAQQQNSYGSSSSRHPDGDDDDDYMDSPDGTPRGNPRQLMKRGSISNLLPPGQQAGTAAGGQKLANRNQRKRAPNLSRGGGNSMEVPMLPIDGAGVIQHVHPKSDELAQRILSTLSCKAPFQGHDASDLAQLVAAMAPVEFKEGVDVINEGDAGDLAYWVESGSLAVVVGGVEVDTIGADTVFGEVALIYDLERTATIRTKSACSMWLLHRAMFQHILRDNAIAERKVRFAFLKTVRMFASLSHREISRVADVVEEVTFEAEQIVISEGDEADSMYVIQEGQAVVSQRMNPDAKPDPLGGGGGDENSLLRILKTGDYFGEKALLTQGVLRTATVTAASRIKCLKIDKSAFEELLGSLRQELIRRAPSDGRRGSGGVGPSPASIRSGRRTPPMSTTVPVSPGDSSSLGSPAFVRPPPAMSGGADAGNASLRGGSAFELSRPRKLQPKSEHLALLTQLGSGGYGRVMLVRDTKSRRVYALKKVCRDHLLSHNGQMRCEWLIREKRVLEQLEHPFIVRLHGTYADAGAIYLLLSVAMGGDLYRLIEKLGQVPEKVARFYISSVVLALAHIHSHEIVYRDLKPENVLLDVHGFVKVCDFGFAKQISDRTYTRCGTPDYTAPEMLLNQGVNQACDWWALGILVFEMIVGMPPFTDPDGDDMKTYQNITVGDLFKCYPDDSKATDEARALIQGLCTVKVAYRLGYLKGGAADVQAHAWFSGYDWDGLVNSTIEPPWRPQLSSCDDTTCFDDQSSGGTSLDGPQGREYGDDLKSKWKGLQEEYWGGSGVEDDMGHLLGKAPSS